MSDANATKRQSLTRRENQLFLALTIVIGIVAGLSAVLFSAAIDQVARRLFGLEPSRLRLFAIPPLMSIVTGVLLSRAFPDARGSGVPQTEAAYHLAGGVIPARVPIGKFITGVLCIGSGHSMGREGPSVQIGAGLASTLGRWFHLPPERVRDLVPVGAAGALAAAFNTPVAAVLFALEEIIGDMNAALIGSTVVASVASVVVERSILGNEPLLHVPPYHLEHPAELIAYAVLGVAGGIVSLAFIKGLLGLRRLFLDMPPKSKIVQPAIGGLVIGIILVFVPAVMGVGYEYVDQALNGSLALRVLILLCFVKLAATVVSYASGNAGGIFAPSLYIGAMAGGALGTVVHAVAPFPTAGSGAYALVGMGALFAGIIRAPMTSVFMIFELTQDYQIIVPLMVANMLSFVISRRFQPVPVYHALLQQDHVHLPAPAATAASPYVSAGSVMTDAGLFVSPECSIEEACRHLRTSDAPGVLVGSHDKLVGVIGRGQIEEAAAGGHQTLAVGSLVEGPPIHVHPDHPIDVVLHRFAESPDLLPVVSRTAATRVEGVITLPGIVDFIHRRRRVAAPSPNATSDRPQSTVSENLPTAR